MNWSIPLIFFIVVASIGFIIGLILDKILEPRYIENDLRNKGEVEHYCTFCKRNTTFRFRELPPNKDNPLSTYYLPLGRDEAEKWWKCDECNSWRETIVDISIKQLLKGVILRFK